MAESTRPAQANPLYPIFLIVLVDVLGLTIVLPLLPLYAERFGASAFVASLLVPTYAFCQLIAGPILGGLSDKWGRRPVLLLSQCGTFAGFLMIAFAPALWVVFLGRVIDGFTAGNLSVAQAYIADNTAPKDRAKSFAIIGIAFGVGFMLGPTIAASLSHYGYAAPFLAAAGLSASSIVCTATLLPKGVPSVVAHGQGLPAGRRPSAFDFAIWGHYFRKPVVGGILVEFFLYLFVFSMFMSGFALFAERRYMWHGHAFAAKEIGLLYGLAGAVGIVIQGGLLGRLVRRFGEAPLIAVGLVSLGGGFLMLPHIEPLAYLILATVLIAAGNAMLRPNLTSLLSRSAAAHEQGVVLGLSQSLASVASILAAPLSGWLIEHGHFMLWSWVAGSVCLLALWVRRFGSAHEQRARVSEH